MAYSSIVKPSVYFNTKLYTGNNSTNAITGIGHQPDLVWIKRRNITADHILFDAVRGVQKGIFSSRNSAQETEGGTRGLNAFNSDGFTLGAEVSDIAGSCNGNNDTYAAWNWKANGQGSSNTAGSINTTYTSVNTTAGFSISTYTGNGSAGATIGHGLGVIPKMIIAKKLNGSPNWGVYHAGLGSASKYLELNTTAAEQTNNGVWDGATPTASVFYVGSDNKVNSNGDTYVAYCFAEKKGYSKFSSYTGNGNADGTFVYTGFKPAFFMTKRSDGSAGWQMYDGIRDVDNPADHRLQAQSNAVELVGDSNTDIDFLSNGFKMRAADSDSNANGGTYIYMAFAENPLVANSGTDGVPATAK